MSDGYRTEFVKISDLKPHPKNYRAHGPDQLDHIVASIKTHGFYRNVVTARDGTILAGHGVVEACKQLGADHVPVVRLDIDPNDTRALKVLTGDNEIAKLGMVDDRILTEILNDISKIDVEGLLGTGFDDMMLANLVFVTRPADEIRDLDAAKEWVGLPAYDAEDETKADELIIEISFKTTEDRDQYVAETGLKIASTRGGRKWATFWPFVERKDLLSVRFQDETTV